MGQDGYFCGVVRNRKGRRDTGQDTGGNNKNDEEVGSGVCT